MKKILTYIAVAVSASLAVFSCSKNEAPVFDDAKAFIAFSSSSATVSEQEDTISLTVSLASVAGLEGTATFKVVPDTVYKVKGKDTVALYPVEGVNFKVLTEGGTLKFDKTNRTQSIKIAGVYHPEYTGDLSFRIILDSKSVDLGYAKECTVVISDVDHPLTSILGDYEATSTGYAYNNPFTLTIHKDSEDDHKVWIDNLFANSGWVDVEKRGYGVVNEEDGALVSITIPVQKVVYKYPYGGNKYDVYLYMGYSPDGGSVYLQKTGSLTVTIGEDGSGHKTLDFGTGTYDGFVLFIDTLGWAGCASPHITAVKK